MHETQHTQFTVAQTVPFQKRTTKYISYQDKKGQKKKLQTQYRGNIEVPS